MNQRGFTQWLVKRTDLIGSDSGAYYTPKTKGGATPPPVQSTMVVYCETLEEALEQASVMMGVEPAKLTATRIMSGFGVGESG